MQLSDMMSKSDEMWRYVALCGATWRYLPPYSKKTPIKNIATILFILFQNLLILEKINFSGRVLIILPVLDGFWQTRPGLSRTGAKFYWERRPEMPADFSKSHYIISIKSHFGFLKVRTHFSSFLSLFSKNQLFSDLDRLL